jgi:hypothetical protein
MTTQHTPGPWTIANGHDARVYLIDDARGHAVGELVYADARKPADARLIAAAPDLLAALRKLIGAIDRLPGNNPLDGLADEARAAIARATGADQ